MKKLLIFLWECFKIFIFALVIVLPIRYFLFQPFLVRGESMAPTLQNGDYLIVEEITYRFTEPRRGDIIVLRSPLDPRVKLVKRIVGLPGETIQCNNGELEIITKERKIISLREQYLPEGFSCSGKLKIFLNNREYFVLGDNRKHSLDSRYFGPVSRDKIIGRVVLRAWPFFKFKLFYTPDY